MKKSVFLTPSSLIVVGPTTTFAENLRISNNRRVIKPAGSDIEYIGDQTISSLL